MMLDVELHVHKLLVISHKMLALVTILCFLKAARHPALRRTAGHSVKQPSTL